MQFNKDHLQTLLASNGTRCLRAPRLGGSTAHAPAPCQPSWPQTFKIKRISAGVSKRGWGRYSRHHTDSKQRLKPDYKYAHS